MSTRGGRALERVLAAGVKDFKDPVPAPTAGGSWSVFEISGKGRSKVDTVDAANLSDAMRVVSAGVDTSNGRAKARVENGVGTMLWQKAKLMLELVPAELTSSYEDDGETVVSAAKDAGDAKGDKARTSAMGAMVDRAMELQEAVDLDEFPEAKAALDAVASLSTIVTKVSDAQQALKNAPSKTEEAIEAQAELDKVRMAVDAMLPPTKATLDALDTLLNASIELEKQFAQIKQQSKAMETQLTEQKDRVSRIAEAVKNAAGL